MRDFFIILILILIFVFLFDDQPFEQLLSVISAMLMAIGAFSLLFLYKVKEEGFGVEGDVSKMDITNTKYDPNLVSSENPPYSGGSQPTYQKMGEKNRPKYEKMPETRMSYDTSDYDFASDFVYTSGDDLFASKGKDTGARAKQAIDIRSTYDASSLRGYLQEELDEHEKRIWWEDNQDLEQFM